MFCWYEHIYFTLIFLLQKIPYWSGSRNKDSNCCGQDLNQCVCVWTDVDRCRRSIYMFDSLWVRLSFSKSLSWEMSLYGFFLSFSSSTEFPISTSLLRSSCRDKNSTMPAPIESPRTLVVVRRRSLHPRGKTEGTKRLEKILCEWGHWSTCHMDLQKSITKSEVWKQVVFLF